MFKIALDAGHGFNTAGKRCMRSIDPNETREWMLNSRICNKIEDKLKEYEGYSLIRLDDISGKKNISLSKRTNSANSFNADILISVHHNAGIKGGSGGGVVAYTYTKADAKTEEWQHSLYNAIIKHTGLKGNRSNPIAKANFYICRESNMPAILLECGFMDSTTDVPIILRDDFADRVATAVTQVLVEKGRLVKTLHVVKPDVSNNIDVIYQVWDGDSNRWLPNVKNLEDYAGIYGHDICGIYAETSKGNIMYRVHYKGGYWLPEVKNRNDYAGILNKPIDGLMMKTDTGKTIRYAVHLQKTNRWLPFVTGYDENDFSNGYAGIIGQLIDAIQVYFE